VLPPLDDIVVAAGTAPAVDSAVPIAAGAVVVVLVPSPVAGVGIGVAGVVVTSADDGAGAATSLPGVALISVPDA
jgi:hypothetical protein